jgi:hypothetical protein
MFPLIVAIIAMGLSVAVLAVRRGNPHDSDPSP